MRNLLTVCFLVAAGCETPNPGVEPDSGEERGAQVDGGSDADVVAVPDLATFAPMLSEGKWQVRTTGTLTNTCGILDPAEAKAVWTIKVLSPDEADLYTGQHAGVRLARVGTRYEGAVPELVSPFPQCIIRDRLRYVVRLMGTGAADGVLEEQFETAAGNCVGVMSLPCEMAQGFEMTAQP
jgi:hypothetical protein